MLWEQNDLQGAQILEMTHYLKLLMVQVHEHHGVLYELDTKLLILIRHSFPSWNLSVMSCTWYQYLMMLELW